MDYKDQLNRRRSLRDDEIRDFWQQKKERPIQAERQEMISAPQNGMIAEHSGDVLYHWRGPEFEELERDKKWYLVMGTGLFCIIAWALISDSPVMAITFILIGVVGFIFINNKPRELDFIITYDGVIAGREMYDFENLESFWIFYEPPQTKILSIKTKGLLLPHVHIPLHDEDPVKIREILLDFIPEIKQDEGIIEIFERLVRL